MRNPEWRGFTPEHEFNSLLPVDAQIELMRAAQTPITEDDPLARRKAVDKAIERVKSRYPNYFR